MIQETKEKDYLEARNILTRELSRHPAIQTGMVKLPELQLERGDTKLGFLVPHLDKSSILDSIGIIKHHIENIRIHSLDSNYLCIQAMNENLFDTKNLTTQIKFRFYLRTQASGFEISKTGNLKEYEILTIIELFNYFFRSTTSSQINPKEVLQRLGIEVFDPIEADIKGKSILFDQIYGYEGVKQEIMETIIVPMKNPDTFSQVSALTRKFPTNNRPRAVLLEGEPGVGKTTMAKAISCISKIPMIYVPIESIMSKYYGESAQNLALIFDAAKLFPEALIFLDEIDSLAGRREDGMFEATRTMLSVLLRKLDGFEGRPGTITLGATNRKQDLDSALLSRFDKSIYFPLPNQSEITAILSGYAKHLQPDERSNIASYLNNYSGRRIKDFCDYVERKWATELIENNQPPSPPPPSLYIQVAENL